MNSNPMNFLGGVMEGAELGLPPGPWQMQPCKACNSPLFDQRFIMMHQSCILAKDGKDKTALHPVMTCSQCGWVHGSPVEEKEQPTVETQKDNIHVFQRPPSLEELEKDEAPPPPSLA